MKKRFPSLSLERFEDRSVPAILGSPWPDPQHLTVSFAPDGTSVNGAPSSLFQTMNAVAPTAAWETTILQALQTWASQANINIGLVADNGAPVGSPGPLQGVPGFGEIRVDARPLGANAVALGSPYSLMGGAVSGNMTFNSSMSFGTGGQGQYDLFTVALHEAGHVFGLADSTDPTSAMYYQYNGPHTVLNATDVADLQTLYGTRIGPASNNSAATAAAMLLPVAQGTLNTAGDANYFRYTVPLFSSPTVTVGVQTAGLSLLAPQLTVYNSAGQVVASSTTSDPLAGSVSVQLSGAAPGTAYYLKVSSGRGDAFDVGSYRLKADSGTLSQILMQLQEAVYSRTTPTASAHGGQQQEGFDGALNLNSPVYQQNPAFYESVIDTISTAGGSNYYRVSAPAGASQRPLVLSVTASQSGLTPAIRVFDADGNTVAADVLSNQHGTYVVQVANAAPGAAYYVKVLSDPYAAPTTGSYLLAVSLPSTPLSLSQLATSTLSAGSSAEYRNLNVSETQTTHLVLSVAPTESWTPAAVRVVVYDQTNSPIFVLTAMAGGTVSGDVFLQNGTYRVAIVAATADGSALPPLTYTLSNQSLTDPLDPLPTSPTSPTSPAPPPPPPGPTTVLSPPTALPPPSPLPDPILNPYQPPPPALT